MSNLIFLSLLLINLNKGISSNNNTCFEYSCEECNSQEYGNCTKCRFGWTLIDGTCPCFNSSCAVCATGFFSTDSCQLCKKVMFGIIIIVFVIYLIVNNVVKMDV